ncbi:MAG: S-layer protein [Candidatus Woesearchaeota archaeon]
MQMKKVVKGIVAVGSAAMLMGSTVLGATMDLSNYPAPFSEDGEFNGNLVVGANAATADVIGAVDVASALQAANVEETSVSVDGSMDHSVSVEDGVALESRGQKLNLDEDLSVARGRYDSESLPSLLSEGEIVDETGTNNDIEFSERLEVIEGMTVEFDTISVDDEDIVSEYVDMASSAEVNFTIDFDDTVEFDEYEENEEISILGKTFVIDDELDYETGDDELILYGSTQEASVELGEAETFMVGGEEVEIEVIGGSEDTAVIEVDGRSRSVGETDTIRVNGEEIRVKDVMYSDIGDRVFIIVNLMLGSDELVLSGNEVELNGEVVDSVSYTTSNSSVDSSFYDGVDEIEFKFDFQNMISDNDDWDYEALLPGDSITEEVFDSIKLTFDGAKGDLESGDYVDFSVGSDESLEISFENYDGEEYSIEPIYVDSDDELALNDWINETTDVFTTDFTTLGTDLEDKYFLHNEEIGDDYLTRLFEVTEVDESEDEITIKNVATGTERTYSEGSDYFYGSDYSEAEVATELHTREGLNVSLSQFNATDLTSFNVTLVGEETEKNITVEVNSDDELDYSVEGTLTEEDDDDTGYALTNHTYYVTDEDDQDRVELWYSGEDEREFAAALGNNDVDITVTEGGASEVMTETVNKIGSGMAYLDSEVDVEGKNIISVGGPAANEVSAELLGDYEGPEGFGEGQAFVKLVENGDNVAMVVAGYSAQDTRHASSVLADYEDYDLSGEEVLVSGTSMADVEVSSVE